MSTVETEGTFIPVVDLDDTYEVQHGDGRWLRVQSVIEVLSPVHRALITIDAIGSGGVDPAEEFLARKVATEAETTLHGHTYKACSDFDCPVTALHCQCGTAFGAHSDDDPDADGEGNLHRGRPE